MAFGESPGTSSADRLVSRFFSVEAEIELSITRVASQAMDPAAAAEMRRLCDAAYATSTGQFFDAVGPGEHLLGRRGKKLVAHLMWVTRWLQPHGHSPLRTAYVEMVATAPAEQRKGYASALLQAFPRHVQGYDLAALSPATEGLYARQGWRLWRGPLAVRTAGGSQPTPQDRVMVLPLPKTPQLDLSAPLSVEWRSGEVW